MGRFQRPAAGSPSRTTMSRTDLNVVFLPGLGADGRLFTSQREVFPDLLTPPWPPPAPDESLPGYAVRLAGTLPLARPLVLGGCSFGGMVACEMARILKPDALVLMGSVSRPQRDSGVSSFPCRPIPDSSHSRIRPGAHSLRQLWDPSSAPAASSNVAFWSRCYAARRRSSFAGHVRQSTDGNRNRWLRSRFSRFMAIEDQRFALRSPIRGCHNPWCGPPGHDDARGRSTISGEDQGAIFRHRGPVAWPRECW